MEKLQIESGSTGRERGVAVPGHRAALVVADKHGTMSVSTSG